MKLVKLNQSKVTVSFLLFTLSVSMWLSMIGERTLNNNIPTPSWFLIGLIIGLESKTLMLDFTINSDKISYSFVEIPLIFGLIHVNPDFLLPAVFGSYLFSLTFMHGNKFSTAFFQSSNKTVYFGLTWFALDYFSQDYFTLLGWGIILLTILFTSTIHNVVDTLRYDTIKSASKRITNLYSKFIGLASITQGITVAFLFQVEPYALLLTSITLTIVIFGIKEYNKENAKRSDAEQRAKTDFTTGLANKFGFELHLDEKVLAKKSVGIAFIDMDDFKIINDTYGHNAGDKLLVEIANRLKESVRKEDLAARMGGDEFAVVFESEGIDINTFIKRLDKVVNLPVTIDGIEMNNGASVGFAVRQDGEHKAAFLERADKSMYETKENKKKSLTCSPFVSS